jgi:hypothetical protein
MAKSEIGDGIFVPISGPALQKLFTKLEREGYRSDPDGVALFLHDVASGSMDDEQESTEQAGPIAELLKKHGPMVADMLARKLRSRGV